MAETKVIGPQDLDYPAFVRLQREAYADIITRTGTGDQFTESYYRWKHSPPCGPAKIALVIEQGVPLATNSMYPLRLRGGKETLQGWQSCDTATHPSARGKGYFMKCLAALKESLPAESIFFGYPNQNSMPGFRQFGWQHRLDVNTRVRILPGARGGKFPCVERITVFGDREAEFVAAYSRQTETQIDRDSAYLNWRYFQHPLNHYEAFSWTEKSTVRALIVLRVLTIYGRRIALILELLAPDPMIERSLLRFAAAWARGKQVGIVAVLNNTTGVSAGLACGYMPVPIWALPKSQVLMGSPTGPAAERLWRAPWNVQIGDWDGF